MLAHISIPSDNPKQTALFFAALIDGVAFDFPVVDGASVAVARDGSGTAVEVFPPGMAHHPGAGKADPAIKPDGPATLPWEDQIYMETVSNQPSGFHVALETHLSREEVIALAAARGWRSLYCERGGVFGLVEVWIDNRYLVEVVPPDEVARYRNFMNPQACGAMFGAGVAP